MSRSTSDASAELDAFFAAPIGFAIFDRALHYVRVNDAFAALDGVPVPDHPGRAPCEVVPDQNPQLLERLAAVRDTARSADFELVAFSPPRADVERIWRVTAHPVARGETVTGVAATFVDITAQRASDVALRLADERLRASLIATDVGIWHWDPERDVTLGNRNLMRLFGIEQDADETPLAPFLERVHVDDRERVTASIARVRHEGGIYDEVYRVVHDGGAIHWLHARGHAVRNAVGQQLVFPGIVVDVTRHFEAAARQRESDELLRAFLESVHDGICIIEMIFDAGREHAVDYRFIDMNPSFERHAGLVDARGRTARELVPGLDVFWYETYGHVARAGEPVQFDRYEPAMGRWFDVYAMRVGDAERGRVAIRFRDVTESREREAELRRRDAELKRLFDTNLLGILFWDLDGHVHGANDEFLRIVGYAREDLERGAIDWAKMTPDEHKAQDERAVDELRRTGAHAPIEKEYVRKDGSHVWVLVGSTMTEGTRGVGFVLDISRRKAVEAALRTSDQLARDAAAGAEAKRALLDVILEAAPVAIIVADASGELVRMNPANELLWGPAPPTKSVEEYEGWKGWWADSSSRRGRRLEPEEWAMARALHGEIVRDDIVEIQPFGAPDVRRTMVNTGAPVRDADGQITGAVVAQMDISALIASDAARRNSEARFRAIADNIDPLAWMTDETGSMVWHNKRWYDYTGTTPEQMMGWGWRDVLHPDGRERVLEKIRHHFASGERWEDTFRIRSAAGEYRWFLSRAVPIEDVENVEAVEAAENVEHDERDVVRWFGTNTDITELRAAEMAARESQQLLRTTMENFPTVIAFKDVEGRFLDVNAAVERALGLPKDQIIGRSIHDFIPKEAADILREHELVVMQTRQAAMFEEITPLPSGTLHHINANFPLIDAAGEVYGTGHISNDVTAIKEAETALRALNERLEEADRRKDEFIVMLAHELRNPLAPVRTAVDVLHRIGSTDSQAVRARDVIDRQVAQMARLIDDLLEASRIARGNIELQFVRCDLAELAWQSAEDYRASLEAAGLTLVAPRPTRPLWVEGDPVRLAQMIGNLLSNTLRFTEPGGRVEVRAELDATTSRARVRVADTGVGIEPELLARLFAPFIQADQSLARAKGGLGLGLALTKRLAELHHGDVLAESGGKGSGSTFTLLIPVIPEAGVRDAVSTPVACDEPSARPLRLLIVEDNSDAAEMLGMLLGFEGHEVQLAYDAELGLALAHEFSPDVVISDIGLPGELDGYGLARALRAEPRFASVYLIALSGYANQSARRESAEAGFDMHLAKPPDLENLRRKLVDIARARPVPS